MSAELSQERRALDLIQEAAEELTEICSRDELHGNPELLSQLEDLAQRLDIFIVGSEAPYEEDDYVVDEYDDEDGDDLCVDCPRGVDSGPGCTAEEDAL
jgi:hypothetical protein